MFHKILKTSPSNALKYLKEHPKTDYHLEDKESSNTTALQLCAKNGYIEIMLILLLTTNVQINYKKNHKAPLYFALEYQQLLAAQVLLIFGANSQETFLIPHENEDNSVIKALRALFIDKDILANVLLWVAAHLEVYHLTQIPTSLVTFLKQKNSLEQRERMDESDTDPLTTPLLQDSKDFISIDMHEFHSLPYLEPKIVSGLIQFAIDKKQFHFATLLSSLNNNPSSTPTSSIQSPALSDFKEIAEEYDFIAYSTLVKHFNIKTILEKCLNIHNRLLFFTTLFLSNRYLYECLSLLPERIEDIEKLTAINAKNGVIHRIFNSYLSHTPLTTNDSYNIISSRRHALQSVFFNVSAPQFIKFYFKHTKEKALTDKTYEKINQFCLDSKKHAAVISLIKPPEDMKYSVHKNVFFVNNISSLTIRSYLSPEDASALQQTCKTLQIETSFLSSFLDKINHKINTAGYFSHRRHDFDTCLSKVGLAYATLNLLAFGPTLYYLITYLIRMHDLEQQIETNNCVEYFFGYFICNSNFHDICDSLCSEYNNINDKKILKLLISAIIEFIGLPISKSFSYDKIKQTLFKGKERFDGLTLKQFAPELEKDANIIFNSLNEPLTMNSSLTSIRMILQNEIIRRDEVKTNDVNLRNNMFI